MSNLNLRLRVFLFFCLMALGGIAIVSLGLLLGYRQLNDPQSFSAFITVAVICSFGLTGLSSVIWLLFDENVSKPINAISAEMRVRTETGVAREISEDTAKYLGDLAPAASALHEKLHLEQMATSETVAQRTERLEAQRAQLLRILSDIPVAVIVARADHQIVLYDGQAADLMEQECPARLNGSVFDYLDENSVSKVLDKLRASQKNRAEIAVKGCSGRLFKGHVRLFEDELGYTLMLEPLDPDAARPLVYDFDLLDKETPPNLEAAKLRDLSYVIFDSETTGLDPSKDEVIQLGAVRVVNGKIIEGEIFDMFVNPGIPIPPASTKVHHIDDTMVMDAAPFSTVCPAFHQFAEDAVLVAHNAPFDMSFLRREAKCGGYSFDNPILDTVHLSAAVFGGEQEHTLDALCHRLDVDIPQELRHTGLGDAIATARAFVALLPILEKRGLDTFGALRAEVHKHGRILQVET